MRSQSNPLSVGSPAIEIGAQATPDAGENLGAHIVT